MASRRGSEVPVPMVTLPKLTYRVGREDYLLGKSKTTRWVLRLFKTQQGSFGYFGCLLPKAPKGFLYQHRMQRSTGRRKVLPRPLLPVFYCPGSRRRAGASCAPPPLLPPPCVLRVLSRLSILLSFIARQVHGSTVVADGRQWHLCRDHPSLQVDPPVHPFVGT